jgi:hypothetical protein
MTPAELLDHCTPSCLIAGTRHKRCRCQCRGRWHGLLNDADVTVLAERRRISRGLSWLEAEAG